MDGILQVITQGATGGWGLLLICALGFLAGFVDAIAGGGGLISLPAYLFAGLPVHTAIATNKLSSTMGTTVATIKYIRQGYMLWWLAVPCAVVALGASSLGATLSLAADETFIRWFMLGVIPIAGFYVLRTKNFDLQRQPFSRGRTLLLSIAVAAVIGVYDGFYGPGTGTFLMLLLPAIAHLSLDHAAGTTKAINLATNVAALVVFLVHGAALVLLGLAAGVFNIAGNYLGARAFTHDGARIVRPIILVVLVLFAIRLIGELVGIM